MNAIQKQISKIITSLIIAMVTGIISIIAAFDVLELFMYGGFIPKEAFPIEIIAYVIIFGALISSFCLYLIGLKGFAKHLDDVGKRAINLIFISYLIPIGGILFSVVLEFILTILIGGLFYVGFILPALILVETLLAGMALSVYGAFRLANSTSFNDEGAQGVSRLKISIIIYALALLLMLLSEIVSMSTSVFFGYIIKLGAYLLLPISVGVMLSGWYKIRRSFAS